jgi:hypothetical protein
VGRTYIEDVRILFVTVRTRSVTQLLFDAVEHRLHVMDQLGLRDEG